MSTNTLDLGFSKPGEIVKRLCERLRSERLAGQMTQADVAGRAGVCNVGFESIVRVAMVLGRGKELDGLFLPRLESLEDIRRYESSAQRQRSRRKSDSA
jgi:transcriptional regulator with XRE-family HTH domain